MEAAGRNLLARTVNANLHAGLVRIGRRVQRIFYGYGWILPPALEPLPSTASRELRLAHRAWEIAACSPANQLHVCYYSLDLDGFPLPGERPWERRWALLHPSVSWRGARVLELGCNMGLLSAYAMRDGASAALGVDRDQTLLDANRLLQRALDVSYETARIDLDERNDWEARLAAFHPTIVTALSVLHWVNDRDRLLRFLARFDTLLYEGHDSDRVERTRLRQAGFVNVALVGHSERHRSVFLARTLR